jgi:two-component system, response regulator RegA
MSIPSSHPVALPTILVLDEDTVFVEKLRHMVRDHFQVIDTHDQKKVRALILAHRPVCCVTNLGAGIETTGNASGLSYIATLKKYAPAMRVVVVSHYLSIATTVQAIKAGADDCLPRPADGEQLFDLLLSHPRKASVPRTPLALERIEWEIIQRALRTCEGTLSHAAGVLDMHRRTVQRKLAKHPKAERPKAKDEPLSYVL